jgi:aspartyl-tRNA synthetase
MDWKQRRYCGSLNASLVDQDVLLMGWVDAIRDHGNLLFIHMRDIGGIVQVVFDPEFSQLTYQRASLLKEEDVVEIRGRVTHRSEQTRNPNLETGDIEVYAREFTLLSKSKPLPFKISEKAMVFGEEISTSPENVDEDLRLQYRYLDLRRPSIQKLFVKRYEIIKMIRDFLHEMHFVEVETPFLTKSTPEGARDYLVPSRVHQGKFYALPQSPQLFKQILMIGGLDRYFQIARCFRDEDLRPNRQPEFTQLDLEASFIDEAFIYEIIEELTARIFGLGGIHLDRPFARMTHQDAMDFYGTDRPDTRFEMRFVDVTGIFRNTRYGVFQKILEAHGCIKGICVRGQSHALSKNVLQNEYAMKIVPSFGAKGMTWMKVADGKLESNIVQFFRKEEQDQLLSAFEAHNGDVIMMIADPSRDRANTALGHLRLHVAERLDLIPKNRHHPLWVTDFPLFELKDEKLSSQHHPFTMPDRTDFDPDDKEDMLQLKSRAYDLVLNGEELGGGSIRIHDMDIQKKIFHALGLSQQEAQEKFGFFLRALELGSPPHGGLALGLDRVIAMILKTNSIRDVIAFPKNRSAYCPLSQTPSPADKEQLRELGLLDLREQEQTPGQAMKTALQVSEPPAASTTRVSREEVQHVARLARLRFTDAEIDDYAKDLNSILDYAESLEKLNTDDVPPTSHVLPMQNVWREDEPGGTSDAEQVLSNAPDRQGNYYKVPKILEG